MKINILWSKEDKLALALSTGVDSVVLLDLLLTKYKDTYEQLVIFHVNHGFRQESEEEAIFAQKLAQKNNLKFFKKDLHLGQVKNDKHISQEMLAREARYAAFEEFAKEAGVTKVLTGHHKNDNIENVLMRILSSRNVNHRIDIAEKVVRQNFTLLRPMLIVSKSQIEAYAKEKNLEYRQDKSNFDTQYTRNYIRQEIVPNLDEVNKAAQENILEFASHYKELQDYARQKFEEKYQTLKLEEKQEKVTLDIAGYKTLTNLEKNMFISKILNEKLEIYNVSKTAIDSAITKIDSNENNISLDLKNNIKIIKEYQSISIGKFEKKCYNDKIIINKISSQEEIYEFAENRLLITRNNQDSEYGFNKEDLPLLIRNKQEGDRIQRGAISKKVSRLFIDYKIPKEDREKLPILEKDGKILAVLGLGNKVSKEKTYDYYIKILKG